MLLCQPYTALSAAISMSVFSIHRWRADPNGPVDSVLVATPVRPMLANQDSGAYDLIGMVLRGGSNTGAVCLCEAKGRSSADLAAEFAFAGIS